jgi:late competence protein required for DNA uptake (superfamily II DNA/RNA helicase)
MRDMTKKYFCEDCEEFVELVPPKNYTVGAIYCPSCGCMSLREEKKVYLLPGDDYNCPNDDDDFNIDNIENNISPLTLAEFQKEFNENCELSNGNYIYII